MNIRQTSSRSTLIAAIIVVTALGAYSLFQAREMIEGPKVVVDTPQNGSTLTDPLLVLKGHASNISAISLNGRDIYINDAGQWSEQVLLAEGYNTIMIEAQNKFGKRIEQRLEYIYTGTGTASPAPDNLSTSPPARQAS